jgi:hypothetical protein
MLLAELVSVTLVFVFIALGALITALLTWLGIIDSWILQLVAFSASSLLSMLLLRQRAKQWVNKSGSEGEYNEYSGESAMVIKDIPPLGEGRIFYRGTEWIAKSAHGTPISAGSKVLIERAEGIKLFVIETNSY